MAQHASISGDGNDNGSGNNNPWQKMQEAIDTFYGFRNMSPSQREALQRALRAKTPAQMAVREEESRSRHGDHASQTGQQSGSRPHRFSGQRRDAGLASRQSQCHNGGAEATPTPPFAQPPPPVSQPQSSAHQAPPLFPPRPSVFSSPAPYPVWPSEPSPAAQSSAFGSHGPECDDGMDWASVSNQTDALMYCQTLRCLVGWDWPPQGLSTSPMFY